MTGFREIAEISDGTLKEVFRGYGLNVGEFHSAMKVRAYAILISVPHEAQSPCRQFATWSNPICRFLIRETYPPKLRSSFLRSYLFRMGGVLSQAKFNDAVEGRIAAEVAMWSSPV